MQPLNSDEDRALQRLRNTGRGGAVARDLAKDERTGIQLGTRLVKLGLAAVTRSNRFVATEYVATRVPGAIAWEQRRSDPNDPNWKKPPRRIGRIPARDESVADAVSRPLLLGPPCPQCQQPTQVRKHAKVGRKQLRQPFYYTRWYFCVNPQCEVTKIMPPEHRVWNTRCAEPGSTT